MDNHCLLQSDNNVSGLYYYFLCEVKLSILCKDNDNQDNPDWQEKYILGEHFWALYMPRECRTSRQ